MHLLELALVHHLGTKYMNVLNARSPSKIFTSGQVFFTVFVSNETIFSRSHWNYCVSGKSDTFFSAHLAFLLKPDGEFPHTRDGGSRVDEQRVGTLKGASPPDLGHPVHSEQARGGGGKNQGASGRLASRPLTDRGQTPAPSTSFIARLRGA